MIKCYEKYMASSVIALACDFRLITAVR